MQLFNASLDGNLEAVKELLSGKQTPKINWEDPGNITHIIYLSCSKILIFQMEELLSLLQSGSSIKQTVGDVVLEKDMWK